MKIRIIVGIEGVPHPVELELKPGKKIKNCKVGSIIMFSQYSGRFGGLDGKYFLLKTIEGKGGALGFEKKALESYYEEVELENF